MIANILYLVFVTGVFKELLVSVFLIRARLWLKMVLLYTLFSGLDEGPRSSSNSRTAFMAPLDTTKH